jgi:hypothetical protein
MSVLPSRIAYLFSEAGAGVRAELLISFVNPGPEPHKCKLYEPEQKLATQDFY